MLIGLFVVVRSLGMGIRRLAGDPRGQGLLTLVAALITGGALFYRSVEDLSWLDSFYFTIVTLTTVGYGDIAPQTTAGKLFTMAYLIIGVGMLVAFVSEVAKNSVEARRELRARRRDGEWE